MASFFPTYSNCSNQLPACHHPLNMIDYENLQVWLLSLRGISLPRTMRLYHPCAVLVLIAISKLCGMEVWIN